MCVLVLRVCVLVLCVCVSFACVCVCVCVLVLRVCNFASLRRGRLSTTFCLHEEGTFMNKILLA